MLSREEGDLYLKTIARAHRATKAARPMASTVTDQIGRRALTAGKKAARGDGRISKDDALSAMPKDLASLFLYARGAKGGATSPAPAPATPSAPATPPAPPGLAAPGGFVIPPLPEGDWVIPSVLPPLTKLADGPTGAPMEIGGFDLTPRALSPYAAFVADRYSLGWPSFARVYELPAAQLQTLLTSEVDREKLAGILTLLAWGQPLETVQHTAATQHLSVGTAPIQQSEVSAQLAGGLAKYDIDSSTPHNVARLHAGFQWLADAASQEPGVVLRKFVIDADETKTYAVLAISPSDRQVRVFGWHNII